MPRQSAGLMMFRRIDDHAEVFLVHPGGPFWAKKDQGAWTLPKGEYVDGEEPLDAACREFREETGFAPEGPFIELGSITQRAGKRVMAWAFEGDCDPARLVSNTCQIEWPTRSGKLIEIPEVDRGRWFSIAQAREYILQSQEPLLDALTAKLPGIFRR